MELIPERSHLKVALLKAEKFPKTGLQWFFLLIVVFQ